MLIFVWFLILCIIPAEIIKNHLHLLYTIPILPSPPLPEWLKYFSHVWFIDFRISQQVFTYFFHIQTGLFLLPTLYATIKRKYFQKIFTQRILLIGISFPTVYEDLNNTYPSIFIVFCHLFTPFQNPS